jgi:NAD(P)-dependent dehydrogenase (short-subunit alcohol dehydrogenase family)
LCFSIRAGRHSDQDVTLEETWPGIIEATERRFGRLGVMVANAGIGILCKAVEISLAD